MSFLNLLICFCFVNKFIRIIFLDLEESVKVKVAQLCLTLRPHGLNSPGPNTGVGSRSLLRRIQVSRIAGGFLTRRATREA